MSWYDEKVTPSDVLREAARLLCVDGWNPDQGVSVRKEPRNNRFYSPSTVDGAIIRAYQCIRASWYTMTRAFNALYGSLGFEWRERDLKKWEKAPGRSAASVERAVLRAAFQFDSGVLDV